MGRLNELKAQDVLSNYHDRERDYTYYVVAGVTGTKHWGRFYDSVEHASLECAVHISDFSRTGVDAVGYVVCVERLCRITDSEGEST